MVNMIYFIVLFIVYISIFILFFSGDMIFIGLSGGVGKKCVLLLFLYDGDVIEVEIEYIGILCNVVWDSCYLILFVSWYDGRK